MPTIPTGQLPLEDAHHEWNVGLDAAFAEARRPFDTLRDIAVAPGIGFKPTVPFDQATGVALLSLTTKLLKAYRGMLLLCEAGHGHEAVVLLRVVLETSAQLVWIAQHADPRDAVRQVAAHERLRLEVLLTDAGMAQEAATVAGQADAILKTIPSADRDKIKRHWSGLGGFQSLCNHLGWQSQYVWVYRVASSPAHASDVTDHISLNAAGEPVLHLSPGPKFVTECLGSGPLLLDEVIAALQTSFGFTAV